MASTAKPEFVHGGCLCGSVRFKITFPPDHDFAKAGSTCQCSQCRKNSGALIWHAHQVPRSAITLLPPSPSSSSTATNPEAASSTTLRTFSASTPRFQRAFCARCGGFLWWRDEEDGQASVSVGSLDKEELKKWGELLGVARRHLWCEDVIKGVTDNIKGDKWRFDNLGEGAELL